MKQQRIRRAVVEVREAPNSQYKFGRYQDGFVVKLECGHDFPAVQAKLKTKICTICEAEQRAESAEIITIDW